MRALQYAFLLLVGILLLLNENYKQIAPISPNIFAPFQWLSDVNDINSAVANGHIIIGIVLIFATMVLLAGSRPRVPALLAGFGFGLLFLPAIGLALVLIWALVQALVWIWTGLAWLTSLVLSWLSAALAVLGGMCWRLIEPVVALALQALRPMLNFCAAVALRIWTGLVVVMTAVWAFLAPVVAVLSVVLEVIGFVSGLFANFLTLLYFAIIAPLLQFVIMPLLRFLLVPAIALFFAPILGLVLCTMANVYLQGLRASVTMDFERPAAFAQGFSLGSSFALVVLGVLLGAPTDFEQPACLGALLAVGLSAVWCIVFLIRDASADEGGSVAQDTVQFFRSGTQDMIATVAVVPIMVGLRFIRVFLPSEDS